MRKDLLFAAIAAATSRVGTLTYHEALRLIDIEHDTASKFSCVKYLEKLAMISGEVATELNAEIYRQSNDGNHGLSPDVAASTLSRGNKNSSAASCAPTKEEKEESL